MTTEEMKALKVGDRVKDLKRSKAVEREVLCEVESIDEISIMLTAVFAKDAKAYPHRFFFARDAESLELIKS